MYKTNKDQTACEMTPLIPLIVSGILLSTIGIILSVIALVRRRRMADRKGDYEVINT